MILRITDGTTTCDLIWHSVANRAFIQAREGWTPSVAARQRSRQIGPLYTDVIEEITIHVCGTSATDALTNLDTLARLLDRAEEWWYGERTTPTKIQYAPSDGSLREAVIIGRVSGDETATIQLAPAFDSNLNAFVIPNVRVRFLRRGRWLLPQETGTGGAATSAAVQSCSFSGGSAVIYSPMIVEVSGLPMTATGTHAQGVLFYADATTRLYVEDATALGGTGYTTDASPTNNPQGAGIKVYTPTGTAAADTTLDTLGGSFDTGAQTIAVYAVLRNNSTTRTYTVQAITSQAIAAGGTFTVQNVSKGVTVGPEINTPRIVNLGTLVSRSGHSAIGLRCAVDSTAGSGTLDIDYLVLLAQDNPACGAVVTQSLPAQNFNTSSTATLQVHAGELTTPLPRVRLTANGLTLDTGYVGNAQIQTIGSVVALLWIATGGIQGAAQAAKWRYNDNSGSPAAPLTYALYRNLATLVPR